MLSCHDRYLNICVLNDITYDRKITTPANWATHMKILIIDNEDTPAQLIRSKLEALGHQISIETNKDKGFDLAASDQFDIVFFDPSPLNDARPGVLNLRRNTNSNLYIILLSSNFESDGALKAGANAMLAKPVDSDALEQSIENAAYLLNTAKRISDDSKDFPSAGGVIAKSAFNQLFLSTLERADRYGEQTYILFIALSNYQEILELDGAYAADFAVAKLSQHLVRIRRQSDIIGQTAKYEYALLLQRPIYETEPVEATNRFAEELGKCDDIVSGGAIEVEITVSLVDIPAGLKKMEHIFKA